jgi:hypothetical protein
MQGTPHPHTRTPHCPAHAKYLSHICEMQLLLWKAGGVYLRIHNVFAGVDTSLTHQLTALLAQ